MQASWRGARPRLLDMVPCDDISGVQYIPQDAAGLGQEAWTDLVPRSLPRLCSGLDHLAGVLPSAAPLITL